MSTPVAEGNGRLRLQDQILHMIFGADSGRMVADFSCAYEKHFLKQGRLYVSTRFLCFYSNLFGFEEKLRIPYADIVAVRREKTALVIDNAIYVTTSDSTEYQFRSFWDRDGTIGVIDKCWQLNRLGGFRVLGAAGGEIGRRRSESHPEVLDRRSAINFSSTSVSRMRSIEYLDLHASATSLESIDISESLESRRQRFLGVKSELLFTPPRPKRGRSASSTVSCSEEALPSESPADIQLEGGVEEANLRQSFEAAAGAAVLRIEVVCDEVVDISLGEFFATFLADRAPFGLDRFQLLMKESEVEMGEWTREDDDGRHGRLRGLAMRRSSRFRKPVNTFGIDSTLAEKHSLLTIFPDCGIVLTAVTRLDESSPVPGASCFGVHDSMVVRELDDGSVSVSIYFEMRFTQQTLLQYFIELESNRNTLQYLNGYLLYLQEKRVGGIPTSASDMNPLLGETRTEISYAGGGSSPDADLKTDAELPIKAIANAIPPIVWNMLFLFGASLGLWILRYPFSRA